MCCSTAVMHADITLGAVDGPVMRGYRCPPLHALVRGGHGERRGGTAAWMLGRWLGRNARLRDRPGSARGGRQTLQVTPMLSRWHRALRRPRGRPTSRASPLSDHSASIVAPPPAGVAETKHQRSQPPGASRAKRIAGGQANSRPQPPAADPPWNIDPSRCGKDIHAASRQSHLRARHRRTGAPACRGTV